MCKTNAKKHIKNIILNHVTHEIPSMLSNFVSRAIEHRAVSRLVSGCGKDFQHTE